MNSDQLKKWQKLLGELRNAQSIMDSKWVDGLELFGKQLTDHLGAEPTVLMSDPAIPSLTEIPFSDYVGWNLKARHAAVYRWKEGAFRRIAWTGDGTDNLRNPLVPSQSKHEHIEGEAILPRWLTENGTLVRNQLNLSGLSANESEHLIDELDGLDASLVSPVFLNESLWGFIVLGPPAGGGDYDPSAWLYLNLYGLNILSLSRKQKVPGEEHSQDKALRETQELWLALKPKIEKVQLLVLEEEKELALALGRYFEGWGIEVTGVQSEKEAFLFLKKRSPHLLLVDMHIKGVAPLQTVKAARVLAPHAVIFGSSGSHRPLDFEPQKMGIQRLFPKPCRFVQLAGELFEAAISVSLNPEAFSPAPTRPDSLLIAEEETEAAGALKSHFESTGIRVWVSRCAADILNLAELARPSVVLLDLSLPAASKRELIRQIRKLSPASRVVELTSSDEESVHYKGNRPDATCLKPASVSMLEELLGVRSGG